MAEINVNEQIETWSKRMKKGRKQWQKMAVLAAAETRIDTLFECGQVDASTKDRLKEWITAERVRVKPPRGPRPEKQPTQAPAPAAAAEKSGGLLSKFAW